MGFAPDGRMMVREDRTGPAGRRDKQQGRLEGALCMSNLRKILVAAASVGALTIACDAAMAKEAKTIGLAVANLQANFFNQIKQAVEAQGAKDGITIITVDAKGDAATQVSQVQD